MIDEFNRLIELWDYYGFSNNAVYEYLVFLIQLGITIYVFGIYCKLIFSEKSFFHIQAIALAIVCIAISYKFPSSFISLEYILTYIKDSNILAFIIGIVVSFVIIISKVDFSHQAYSSIAVFIVTCLIVPSINGVSWGIESSYYATAGKILGVIIGHSLLVVEVRK